MRNVKPIITTTVILSTMLLSVGCQDKTTPDPIIPQSNISNGDISQQESQPDIYEDDDINGQEGVINEEQSIINRGVEEGIINEPGKDKFKKGPKEVTPRNYDEEDIPPAIQNSNMTEQQKKDAMDRYNSALGNHVDESTSNTIQELERDTKAPTNFDESTGEYTNGLGQPEGAFTKRSRKQREKYENRKQNLRDNK